MKASTELKILKFCENRTVAQALRILEIMDRHIENKKLTLRVKTVSLKIGE